MSTDQLSATFPALADPTRRAILARLAEGEATVNELAEPFEMTVQAVSKHLKVLEHAGLIARGRSAQLRPSRLQGEALGEAADWLGEYRASRRTASTASASTCKRGGRGRRPDARDRARMPGAARRGVAAWTEPARPGAGGAGAAGSRRPPR